MGKTGAEDSGGHRVVKRQVVSVCGPGVEVVSEEKFARRLQGMSGCVGCHRERNGASTRGPPTRGGGKAPPRSYPRNNNNNNSGSHSKNNGKQGRRGKQGKRAPSKANTPIVIHIKDTLRSALPHKERSFDTDSDVSVRSVDEDLFGDVSSIPEFKPQYMYPVSDSPPLTPTPLAVSSRTREKSKKNLTALISVIEKAHHKESRHIESNLVDATSGDSKLCRLLNNEVRAHEKSFSSQQRSIVDCENVDVICNDLYKHGKGGPVEDTDSVSDRSSVSSSSEAVSDPDALFVEESAGFEFSPEELQRLADYTTGYPIYRYDCSPSECPQCMSMWYYHQACLYEGCYLDTASSAHSAWTRGDCQSEDHDTTLEASEDESEMAESENVSDGVTWRTPGPQNRTPSTSTPELTSDDVSWGVPRDRSRNDSTSSILSVERVDSLPPSSLTWASWTTSKSRQLWDIDISHGARPWERGVHPASPFPSNVYLDLTGTDVSISVFYHHSLLQDQGVQATLDAMARESAGSVPPSAPLYSLCYQGSPVCGLSLPVSFFTDRQDLPQIAMVPPHELKRYQQDLEPPRRWMGVASYDTDSRGPSAEVVVMSYNLLCDKYCTRQQYGYCPTWALCWNFRRKALMTDITRVNPDICCLQEVETKEFCDFFQSQMGQLGLRGFFAPKSRAHTMKFQTDKDRVDGCAIMYKADKFQLVDTLVVEFNKLAMDISNGHGNMLNRVMPRDNIGLVALLRTKPGIFTHGSEGAVNRLTPNLLMVATAHLHWDPEDSDVKMMQTIMFMAELHRFMGASRSRQLPANSSQPIPLILCGDLNSLPDSGVVKFLTQGKVPKNHPEFRGNDYSGILQDLGRVDDTHVYHNFQLQRACENAMPFTNFTYDFKGVIDYILHSSELLTVKQQLELVGEDWFQQHKVLGCPNAHVPSDHFCLAAVFEMAFGYHPESRSAMPQKSKSPPQQESKSLQQQDSESPLQLESKSTPQQQQSRSKLRNRSSTPHSSRRIKKPNRGKV